MTYLTIACQYGMAAVGCFASASPIILCSVVSLTNPLLNDGVDLAAYVVRRFPKKSPGCGKSWNQSSKPIWAFVFGLPIVEKNTVWSSVLVEALNPIWLSSERR